MEFFKEFFKNLLLWNRWSDFEIISQDCSLCDPFQKLLVKFWSVEKRGRGGGGAFFTVCTSEKFFKILLLWNCLSDFEIISQDCSLGDPFRKLFPKKHGRHGGDFLHYTDIKKFLKNLLLWNPWSNLELISQECSLGAPFQKLFVKFWSVKKTWPPRMGGGGGGRLFALYGHKEILKKIFFSETAGQNLN